MAVRDTIKATLGVDDQKAAELEQQMRDRIIAENNGQMPSDQEIEAAIPQIAQAIRSNTGGQQAPAKPSWNAPEQLAGAEDKYQSALKKIESRRKSSNVGQALLSRFNPNRVDRNNKRLDDEADRARDQTLGSFERMNKAQGEQTQNDWNTKVRTRAETEWGQKDSDRARSEADIAAQKDPNSELSQKSREVVQKLGLTLSGNESYETITKVMPWIKEQLDQDYRNRSLDQQAENNAAARAERMDARSEAREDRQLTRDIALGERQRKLDEETKEKITGATSQFESMDNALDVVSRLENHPGFEPAVGAGVQKTVNAVVPFLPNEGVPGTDMRDFTDLNAQLQGTTFLAAIQQMKGLGALSVVEGEKAQAALAQLKTSQSEQQYRESLATLKEILTRGREKAAQIIQSKGGTVPESMVNPPQGRRVTLKDGRKVIVDDTNKVIGTW